MSESWVDGQGEFEDEWKDGILYSNFFLFIVYCMLPKMSLIILSGSLEKGGASNGTLWMPQHMAPPPLMVEKAELWWKWTVWGQGKEHTNSSVPTWKIVYGQIHFTLPISTICITPCFPLKKYRTMHYLVPQVCLSELVNIFFHSLIFHRLTKWSVCLKCTSC